MLTLFEDSRFKWILFCVWALRSNDWINKCDTNEIKMSSERSVVEVGLDYIM